MLGPIAKYEKLIDEISKIEERYYSVMFSKLDINAVEKVLEENILYYQEGMAEKYRRDKICQCIFQVMWLIFFWGVGKMLLEVCGGFLRCSTLHNGFWMGVLVIFWLVLGEMIAIKIIHKMSPMSTLIERQLWFKNVVKMQYCPILEFQEKLKNKTINRFRLKPFQSLLEIEYVDEMGITKECYMDVPEGCIVHWEEGKIDFSFLDQIIQEKAEWAGIRFEDLEK